MSKCNCVKKRKWLWAGLGVLLLVAAVALGIFFLGGGQKENTEERTEAATLYWNVERMDYVGKGVNGLSGRMPRSDGYYYVRLAVDGQQKDYAVASRELVNKLDLLDVVGLEFDEEGIIIDVLNINECTGGLVANKLYVKSVDGNRVLCNNQGTYKGLDVTLELDEGTEVYDIGQSRLLCGLKSQVAVDDEILAIRDYDGSIAYIYRIPYQEGGDVYWNIDRKYNSTTKYTTREPDATGFYVFDMALNGEVVQVRTRDLDIASKIDAKAARCTGLTFDENGLVTGVTSATTAAKGVSTFASWAHVLETDGENVYAVKLSGSAMGTEYFSSISNHTKIINVSGVGTMGEYTDIRYGDQIHGILDSRGRIGIVWIVSRLSNDAGYDLYWNVERKYDSTLKTTKRTPSADGYYYIPVATGGKQITVKTMDKAMATKLDSYSARCFAMKIDSNNEIVGFLGADTIHGGSTFGSWYFVDAIDGNNLTVSRVLSGDTEPTVLKGTMASDVQIINGSKIYSSHCGEYGKLKVGDRVHCLKDLDGNIKVVFIVDRPIPGPVYWNITKMAVKDGRTTRQRAEDGYFYFEMAAGGKLVTLKTRDVEVATEIDNATVRCMALILRGDVIVDRESASKVDGCQGGTKSMSYVDVLQISGRRIRTRKDPNSTSDTAGQYFTTTMASGCKVYNVTSTYTNNFGEETTVRVGDRIHVLHNEDGLATVIFVVGRNKPLDEKDNCPCAQEQNWQPWDGATELENGGYYYLTADVQAPAEGFLLQGITVNLRLDGHTISSQGRCFYLKGSAKLNICDHNTRGKLVGNGVAGESGGIVRVYSSSDMVNLWNVDLEAGSAPVAKEGGLISCAGIVSLYDCNLSGGYATSKGGNVQVSSSGTFRMFGGTVADGSAPSSGNINATGRTYLENVQVKGNGLVNMNGDGEKLVNGLTVQRLKLENGSVAMKGSLQLGQVTITGGSIEDRGILPESAAVITCKPQQSQVIMTSASEAGFKMLTSADPEDYALSYNADKKTVTVTCTIVPAPHGADHCACAGQAQGLGQHTCQELSGWVELTREVLVDSPTSGNLAFPGSGNYYLSLDLELTQSIDILPGQQITLCANGCTISDSKRLFRVNGTLNLTDCTGKGEFVASPALAPVFYTYSGGQLNIFGGTLATSYTGTGCTWGGVGALASDAGNAPEKGRSELNLYGGTIKGGTVYHDADGKHGEGGAIYVMGSNTFNMYGGQILGGSAPKGGGLYVADESVVQLLGGSITGGSGAMGGDVHIASKNVTTTLGGDVQIGSLYLGAESQLNIQQMLPTAAIGMKMAEPGVFAVTTEQVGGCFTSLDGQYSVRQVGDQVKFDIYVAPDSHAHCVCGDTAVGLHTHQCQTLIWQAWTSTDSLPTESGNYYLTDHVHLTDTAGHSIDSNTINICLNGFKITGEGRLFWVNKSAGTLSICDHAGNSGSLESPGVADNNAGGLIRHGTGSGHLNLYNITLRRTDEGQRTEVKEGGILSCSAYLEMYNVTLENGYAKSGGNLLLALTSKVDIVNCTITGGTASTTTGGNIRMSGTQETNPIRLTLVDTLISGGAAKTNGDDICVNSNCQVILSGKVTVEGELYLSTGMTLELNDLHPDSRVAVKMAEPGVFALADKDLSGCFPSVDAAVKAFYDSRAGELYLADQARPEPKEHEAHCVCAGAQAQIADHVCQNVTWTALTQEMFDTATADSSPVKQTADGYTLDNGGCYYLNENITIQKTLSPGTGNGFSLCLNGYTLKGDGCRTLFFRGTLALCDCSYTDETQDGETVRTYGGKVISTMTGDTDTHAAVLYVRSDSHLDLYGGNLLDSTADQAKSGGIVYVSGTMNMYGGRIQDGNSAKNGGNLVLADQAVLHLYGGQITGGKAPSGGNVHVSVGKMYIHGGLISGGATSSNGGNIIVTKSTGWLYMDGGRIADGQAPTVNGGNIRVEGTLEMSGGVIADGSAKEGGNIAISGNGSVIVSGGTVEGGSASNCGGNFAVFGKLEVKGDALIRDGIATGDTVNGGGGNIYGLPNSTKITVSGGRIENGKAVKNGANIYLRSQSGKTGYLTLIGGVVGDVHADCPDTVASVYTHNNKGTIALTLGGDVQIASLRMDTENILQLHTSGISDQARICIGLKNTTGTVMDPLDAAAAEYTKIFSAMDAGCKVAVVDDRLVITEE